MQPKGILLSIYSHDVTSEHYGLGFVVLFLASVAQNTMFFAEGQSGADKHQP